MRFNLLRRIAIFLCFFVGIGAFATSPLLMLDPTGGLMMMTSLLPYMQVLPCADLFFQDFLLAGNALFVLNGLCQLVAAGLLLRRNGYGFLGVLLCGVILMLWTGIQFIVFPLNVLTTLYFILGCMEVLTAVSLRHCERKKRKEGFVC